MAGVLALCGAQPPNDPLPPAADNERGFWESRSVVDLNDRLLRESGQGWDALSSRDHPVDGSAAEAALREIDAILTQAFVDAPTLVLKDPRINVLLPLWRRGLERKGYTPVYVVMVRNPVETAASLLRRNGLALERGLMLWLNAMLMAERDTRHHPRVYVTFDQLLANWRDGLARVEAAGADLLWRRPVRQEVVERYLAPHLRHRAPQAVLAEVPEALQTLSREVWRLLCAKAERGEDQPNDLVRAYSRWTELHESTQVGQAC